MSRQNARRLLVTLALTAVGMSAHAQISDALGLLNATHWAAASTQPQQSRDQGIQERDTHAKAVEKKRAQQWGLSVSEWDRYKTLLKGIDGYRSDKLDPLTLLGMHARSAAERKRYARKLARMEHQRVERVLSFQRAYDQAAKALYPNEQRIRTDNIGRSLARGNHDARQLGLDGVRKAVVVRTDDCSACVTTVKRLASSHTPMDIYVIGAGSDDAIRRWAIQVGLDPKRVRSGEITLNHAPQALANRIDTDSLPRVFKR